VVTRSKATKIYHWRREIRRLPAPDVQWRWSDVVAPGDGDGDGRVARRAAYAVRDLLVKDEATGEYATTRRLDEYMRETYSMPLNGDALTGGESNAPSNSGFAG